MGFTVSDGNFNLIAIGSFGPLNKEVGFNIMFSFKPVCVVEEYRDSTKQTSPEVQRSKGVEQAQNSMSLCIV